ncbi:cation diffusion facilitator family transporter [uncultured Amphritea sp.]|uniref:cation diffusion facilitator family transporter n=1 Tax=uncultured Amphritea sp. TaxID=981605 RepID=UPI0025FA07B2|nr:cation diffusion facilitator family transporter [uncultured Amphritea sp.]
MSHNHNHNHSHSHQVTNYNRAFAIGIALNLIFVVIEVIYGVLSESLALIADAGHNLSDVFSLVLAWGASYLAKKAATEKRTYGLRKATVMASLGSAILLLIALGGIAWEAINRVSDPAPVEGMTVIVVASIGVVINTLTALLFFSGQKDDLNIKGAFLHMAADAVVSLGVVVAGLFIMFKGWLWIDPVISLVIVAVILAGTLGLLKDSMNYALDAVPDGIDIPELKQYFSGLESVERIHDLHVWPLSTTEIALTVHLVVNTTELDNRFLRDQQQHLHDHYGIAHATLQIESSTDEQRCMLDNVKPQKHA